MNQRDLEKALHILNKYKPDGVTWDVATILEEIFLQGPSSTDMSPTDVKQLLDDGWIYNPKIDCWTHFTS